MTTYSILNREEDGIKRKDQPVLTSPLKEIEWYRVVLDEVHAIKQKSTKQAKYCTSLESSRRWAVTGTTMQTKIDDIAGPLQFLRLSPFGSSYMYGRFLGPLDQSKAIRRQDRAGTENMPNALALLSTIMQCTTMRHTKKQIFQGQQILKLPPRTQSLVMLDMSTHEKALHDEIEKQAKESFLAIQPNMLSSETLRLMSYLLPLRMLASDPSTVNSKSLPSKESAADGGESINKKLTRAEVTKKLTSTGSDQARIDMTLAELDGTSTPSCSICLDIVDEPACTPCGHVFCLECITTVVQANHTGRGPCPSCRADVKETDLFQLKADAGIAAEKPPNPLEGLLSQSQKGTGTKIKALLKSLATMEHKQKAVVFTQVGFPYMLRGDFTSILLLSSARISMRLLYYTPIEVVESVLADKLLRLCILVCHISACSFEFGM